MVKNFIIGAKKLIERFCKEVSVFKITEYKKINEYTCCNKDLFVDFLFGRIDEPTYNVIREGREQEYTYE